MLNKDNSIAETFVVKTGQLDLLLPIYRALLKTDQKDTFDAWIGMNEDFYPFATKAVLHY